MLLIHLGGSDSPPYVWYKGEGLIGRLRLVMVITGHKT